MVWRVFVDFDGTITLDDVTNAILDRFASQAWRSIEAEWQNGTIGSRECMERQVGLIRATPAELDGFIAEQAVDPDFVGFVEDCHRSGVAVTVVSDGLDRVVNGTLRRIGLGSLPSVANHLVQVDESRWRLLFPYADDACRVLSGNCKCAAHARGKASERGAASTIMIGDGRSDLCVARLADVVLAKKELLRLCRKNAIACIPFEDFRQVRSLFADFARQDFVGHSALDHGAPEDVTVRVEETANA